MFDPNRLYTPQDAEMRQIATEILLAQWRSKGVGPVYIKCGRRIRYHGAKLNEWLERQTVEPPQPAPA